jgi:hypothetical protein
MDEPSSAVERSAPAQRSAAAERPGEFRASLKPRRSAAAERPGQLRVSPKPRRGAARRFVLHRIRWWLLTLLLLAPSRQARAQAAEFVRVLVLLPSPQQDAGAWAEISRGVQSAGARALQVADLPIDPIWAACRAAVCAAAAAQAARLPTLLFTRVGDDRLELAWFASDGRHTVSRIALRQRPVAVVAGELFRDAQQKLSLGDQAFLRLLTRPDHALVYLDGELVGLTPFERALASGRHEARVVSSGFASATSRLELRPGEARTVVLTLAPLALTSARNPDGQARPASAGNYLLGSLLLLASVPTLSSGWNALLDRGQCLRAAADGCEVRARFEAKHGVFLAAGALAVIGASYVFIARPFRISAELERSGAGLRLRGDF